MLPILPAWQCSAYSGTVLLSGMGCWCKLKFDAACSPSCLHREPAPDWGERHVLIWPCSELQPVDEANGAQTLSIVAHADAFDGRHPTNMLLLPDAFSPVIVFVFKHNSIFPCMSCRHVPTCLWARGSPGSSPVPHAPQSGTGSSCETLTLCHHLSPPQILQGRREGDLEVLITCDSLCEWIS